MKKWYYSFGIMIFKCIRTGYFVLLRSKSEVKRLILFANRYESILPNDSSKKKDSNEQNTNNKRFTQKT